MIRAKYRNQLPQIGEKIFLTDGGLETTLLFHEGFDLPYFAAFDLLRDVKGKQAIENYLLKYISIAKDNGTGIILDTPTWRASRDWGDLLGYSPEALDAVNRESVELLKGIRDAHETETTKCVINGVIGPRGDGYNPSFFMSAAEAADYHRAQITSFADAGADMITAVTITYAEEAIGITRLGVEAGIPVVISFTVETNGNLPTGEPLQQAIEKTDRETGNGPAYYMINCAHPTHFENVLKTGGSWRSRIGGLRANASRLSHAELDEAEELDDGNPAEFGEQHVKLAKYLPNLAVIGGCCGTDHRHVGAVHQHLH
ncbi:MAG: homocysteine S-methyltransferase family protein [Sneathiella sp.]|nr:homocysteine S-methyltransferase family protein [Sneathiella sp.]